MEQPNHYPPNPTGVPPDLTEMNWPYFFRALFVLGSLTVFIALYLGLVAGTGYLCYSSVMALREPPAPVLKGKAANPLAKTPAKKDNGFRLSDKMRKLPAIVSVAGVLTSGLLFLFLVKGFFKIRRTTRPLQVEITARDQPNFFAFLHRLCRDVGAPLPYRVFVVPEVNAAVVYQQSALSLFLPAPKNLIVGLGLVNRLNVTEFKAVLAHEFGHFSQASMKLGAYVYQANRIIADMVYGRDFFDDFLDRMQGGDPRIDAFVKMFVGLLWTLRKALEGVFHVINFANSSLSRQMEFNADLMSVRVTGSDALVHALARLDLANASLDQVLKDLAHARDHQLFSRDLFHHQNHAARYLQHLTRNRQLGEVPPLPEDPREIQQIFQPGDLGIPLMWATHPSNFDREQNSKRIYIRGILDERSSWTLFDDPDSLRQQITALYYQRVHFIPAHRLIDAEKVQAFLDDEHADTCYPEHFHGVYDDRCLDLVGLEMWTLLPLELRHPARLQQQLAELYGPRLKELMETRRSLDADRVKLQEFAERGKSFTLGGVEFPAADAPRLLDIVHGQLADIDKVLGSHDRQVFEVHYAMAQDLGDSSADELLNRYHFQNSVQEILGKVQETTTAVNIVLNSLAGQRQIAQEQFQRLGQFFQDAHRTLKTSLDAAKLVCLPSLKNMTEGQKLSEFLLPEPLVASLPNQSNVLEGKWADHLARQLHDMLDRIHRLHFKNVAALLGHHARIAEAWTARQGRARQTVSTPTPVEVSA